MKIPSSIREEAALLCAIAASWPKPISVRDVAKRLNGEPRGDVAWLAVRAWDAANRAAIIRGRVFNDAQELRDDYAEAESLLRTGWTPSSRGSK